MAIVGNRIEILSATGKFGRSQELGRTDRGQVRVFEAYDSIEAHCLKCGSSRTARQGRKVGDFSLTIGAVTMSCPQCECEESFKGSEVRRLVAG